jgi:elongation factor 1-beta|uniref:Elongation factor 1-beta n=1 Tax=Candidatus Methanogaster sp. ANME-2c ERB4 TaxID=2759911 RepID=A0A7G9YEU3_9EURY|nr:elongation factor 1-beta [Methanosarcinales archaeon ANME-2c ERB4]QNO46527.1 elongation factor 1-beta [Methanosarcinales archaeon ANME-2c ERB4]
MGEVVAVIKIMPNGVDVDLEKLKENLAAAVPAGIDLNGIAEEPIAFGLVALMATVVVGDVEGGTDSVENAFAEVPDVESVQVAEIGRLL